MTLCVPLISVSSFSLFSEALEKSVLSFLQCTVNKMKGPRFFWLRISEIFISFTCYSIAKTFWKGTRPLLSQLMSPMTKNWLRSRQQIREHDFPLQWPLQWPTPTICFPALDYLCLYRSSSNLHQLLIYLTPRNTWSICHDHRPLWVKFPWWYYGLCLL